LRTSADALTPVAHYSIAGIEILIAFAIWGRHVVAASWAVMLGAAALGVHAVLFDGPTACGCLGPLSLTRESRMLLIALLGIFSVGVATFEYDRRDSDATDSPRAHYRTDRPGRLS